MPVLMSQFVERTKHFNASLPSEISTYEAKFYRTNFRPSFVICFGNEDFLWGMKNCNVCMGSGLGQLEVSGTMRDCNEAKTIGTSKGTPFQENEKKSSFRNSREGGFEENEKWTTIDSNGIESQENALIKWSKKETLQRRSLTDFRQAKNQLLQKHRSIPN